jgi:TPR repeat protein
LFSSVQFVADQFDSCKYRVVGERGKRGTMNSRSCHWLIVSALVITASGAWAQQSAPPVPGQKKQAVDQCGLPSAFDEKSIAVLKQQAVHGKAAAQYSLGAMYEFGNGVPKEHTRATFWLHKAAEQGSTCAQAVLILLYSCEADTSMPEDYSQAVAWFRKSAELGDVHAQSELGCWYARGKGTPQDYAQSALWYRKAAEQGEANAQIELGMLYYEGRGVPQDYAQTALWFRKAAEQRDANAQLALGYLYRDGHGVPQDYAQTVLWFRKSAEQGNASAQRELGCWYKDGQGVPQDYAEAYFWLDLAAAGKPTDTEQVTKFRDEAASHLTPADLSREQERARKWFEAHPAKPQ